MVAAAAKWPNNRKSISRLVRRWLKPLGRNFNKDRLSI